MPSNTTNLGLYKKDPIVDGNDTFNIETMLNQNWDKIDSAVIAKLLEAKGYTDTKIQALLSSAPGALDTLKELADALGDDPNFATTITNYITSTNTSLSDLTYEVAIGTGTVITLTTQTLVNGYAKTFIALESNGGSVTTINGKYLYKPNTTTAPNLIAGKAYTVWYNSTGNCFFIKASAEGDALAANVLASKKFSNDYDTGLTGSMDNNGALSTTLAINGNYAIPAGYTTGGTITQSIATKASNIYAPSTSNQVISAGQYLTGDQTIQATTGTASDEYVLAGKTYNSAAGIGRTGTATIESLGGKKFASATVVSSAAKMTFSAAWSAADTSYYINITGLSFTPNIAVIQASGTSIGCSLTSVNANHSYPVDVVFNNGTSSSYTATFLSGVGCIISNGQLLVPVSHANTTYTYYIYE